MFVLFFCGIWSKLAKSLTLIFYNIPTHQTAVVKSRESLWGLTHFWKRPLVAIRRTAAFVAMLTLEIVAYDKEYIWTQYFRKIFR